MNAMRHVTSGFASQLGMSVTSIHSDASSSNLNNDRALSSRQFSGERGDNGEEEGILLKT